MAYAGAGILAIIHHLIINHEIIKNGRKDPDNRAYFRYRLFLDSVFLFYIVDVLWGFLIKTRYRTLVYTDCVLYFAFMAMSVLLWTRFVVAFLDKTGIKANIFLAAGWLIYGAVLVNLVVNLFYPVLFTITDDIEYIPGPARFLFLGAQLLLFLPHSVYSLYYAIKTSGTDKTHYSTIAVSGAVMALFILLQQLNADAPYYTIGCFITNSLIHAFIEEGRKKEQNAIKELAQKEKERYSQIANGLARDYEAIYYVDIETGNFIEVSASDRYDSMKVPVKGEDFFKETRENAKRYAHPDDRSFAASMYYKDKMLRKLERKSSYSYQYRVMVGDEARYFRFIVMLSDDKKHLVVGDLDITETITAKTEMLEKDKTQITFTQIAESLASNYDSIYYVDMRTGHYEGFTAHNTYGSLQIATSGEDFFDDARNNLEHIIHPLDKERMLDFIDKDNMMTNLEGMKRIAHEYRLVVDDKVEYTRLIARKSSDGVHFIICVENIDNEVKKEKEHLKALNTEKELARRDELTGTKNKTAFAELEKSIQGNIDNGLDYLPFAFAVCDLNDLKKINDTKGHIAGDEYIKAAAKLLCDTFVHSPVFRIGGDEFVIFLRSEDYINRRKLVADLKQKILNNQKTGEGPVIAIGTADYSPDTDANVNEVFERADDAMYENKRWLKGSDVR